MFGSNYIRREAELLQKGMEKSDNWPTRRISGDSFQNGAKVSLR